jgi:hypothetical protein
MTDLESRRFGAEADLVASLLPRLFGLFPDASVAAEELHSGYGIADLVLATPSAPGFDDRLASGLAPLRGRIAAELVLTGWMETDDPARRRKQRQLIDDGFLEHDKPHPALTAAFHRIVAIEAKLYDWRRALSQAVRYQCFADEAYVAMPLARAVRIPRSPFEAARVGLLGVTEDCVSVVCRAQRSDQIEAWRRLLVSEDLVARARTERRLARLEGWEIDCRAGEPPPPVPAALAH